MTRQHLAILAAALVATAALPQAAQAAVASASCTVTADYSLNNSLVEPFSHTFVVNEGVTYSYDFSTQVRFKEMAATLSRVGNKSTVSITYFNDVGTFTAIEIDTSVPLYLAGTTSATSGRHTFYTSQGVVGNHVTAYSVSCKGR